MPILTIIVVLIAVGVLMWAVNTYGGPYMKAPYLGILNFVVLALVVLWLLKAFGIFAILSQARV